MQRPDYPPGCTGPPEPSPCDNDYTDELHAASDALLSHPSIVSVDDGSCALDDDGNAVTRLLVTIEIEHQVGELLPLLPFTAESLGVVQ